MKKEVKLFIWQMLNKVSNNYHEGGGLVVIAESLERAVELAEAPQPKRYLSDEMELGVVVVNDEPTRIIDCAATEAEGVFIFPDAGCC